MASFAALTILVGVALFFVLGRLRGVGFERKTVGALHSRPLYHGAYAAAWFGIPTTLLLVVWLLAQGSVLDGMIQQTLPADMVAGKSAQELNLIISQVRQLARGVSFGEPTADIAAAAATLKSWTQIAEMAMVASVAGIGVLLALIALLRLSPNFWARNKFEGIVTGIMLAFAVVAIVTTFGIVASLVMEALRFFERVPFVEFLTGLKWEPQIAIREDQVAGKGAFGAIPVFLGTLVIAVIAMAVAVPIGLFTAIYLSEYAPSILRNAVKPVLEVLAGIPTVVFGFFAMLVVTPAMVALFKSMGVTISPNPALSAGFVMGIMIIPLISSFADDALRAVPMAMREGSYALGATRAETINRVLIPAAIPGITGGILLAVSRAIGETMIVVMAAGMIATLTVNPLDTVTTTTVQIVAMLTGDTEFDNAKTLSAFALGLVLFIVTLVLNVIALLTVRKYREQYE
jgi:phosphate transport system permease protein